jgi:hypothetical protein
MVSLNAHSRWSRECPTAWVDIVLEFGRSFTSGLLICRSSTPKYIKGLLFHGTFLPVCDDVEGYRRGEPFMPDSDHYPPPPLPEFTGRYPLDLVYRTYGTLFPAAPFPAPFGRTYQKKNGMLPIPLGFQGVGSLLNPQSIFSTSLAWP